MVSKLTTDVVTYRYCTEASIKNKNMRTGKYSFTKKALVVTTVVWGLRQMFLVTLTPYALQTV